MNPIEKATTDFLVQEFLGGDAGGRLTPQTPLMAAGILDSLGAIMLVEFIESHFGVRIEAHEADAEHMGTIERIVRLVEGKKAAGA
ncbi:MAG TPA: acyl carrier protein [Polyangia bacterium]